MTDEELEKKAKKYAETDNRNLIYTEDSVIDIQWQLETAYITGAKENGVVWHDLRKDPNDLPKTSAESDVWKKVLGDDGELWFYDEDYREWNTRGVSMTNWLHNFFTGLIFGVLLFFAFFLGYGFGIKAPEPKASRELELQIKREELKNLQLSNQIKEMALHGEEESDNAD